MGRFSAAWPTPLPSPLLSSEKAQIRLFLGKIACSHTRGRILTPSKTACTPFYDMYTHPLSVRILTVKLCACTLFDGVHTGITRDRMRDLLWLYASER